MKNFIAVVVFVAWISPSSAGIFDSMSFGWGCPSVTTKENFELDGWYGKWYELEKFNHWFLPKSDECPTVKYTPLANGILPANFTNTHRDQTSGTRKSFNSTLQADPGYPDTASRLQMVFQKNTWTDPWTVNYLVLDTDNDQYSVAYSCKSMLWVMRMEFLWIFGRGRSLESTTRDDVYQMLAERGLDTTKLVATDQNSQTCLNFN